MIRRIMMTEGDLAQEMFLYHTKILNALTKGENSTTSLYIPFIERIVAEYGMPDPESYGCCDFCGHLHKVKEGRLLSDRRFICNICDAAEERYGLRRT